jgi:hypothetical protein
VLSCMSKPSHENELSTVSPAEARGNSSLFVLLRPELTASTSVLLAGIHTTGNAQNDYRPALHLLRADLGTSHR